MAEISRSLPAKLFWSAHADPDKSVSTLGFSCFDNVFGELTCDACFFTCYTRSKMLAHIDKVHRAGMLSELVRAVAGEKGDKRAAKKSDNFAGFHCKNSVLGELTCDTCGYTSFKRAAMAKHVAAKHGTKKSEEAATKVDRVLRDNTPIAVAVVESDLVRSLFDDSDQEYPGESFPMSTVSTVDADNGGKSRTGNVAMDCDLDFSDTSHESSVDSNASTVVDNANESTVVENSNAQPVVDTSNVSAAVLDNSVASVDNPSAAVDNSMPSSSEADSTDVSTRASNDIILPTILKSSATPADSPMGSTVVDTLNLSTDVSTFVESSFMSTAFDKSDASTVVADKSVSFSGEVVEYQYEQMSTAPSDRPKVTKRPLSEEKVGAKSASLSKRKRHYVYRKHPLIDAILANIP